MTDQVNVQHAIESHRGRARTPSVMIGIVNHNRSHETIECIKSLQQCTYPNIEILIIDNGSTDDSVERIRKAFPSIALICSGKNVGPAGGRNIIFRTAREKLLGYLLILDNDTVVEKGFLEPLVNALEIDREAVVAGGTILEYENPERIWYAGGRLVPLRGLAVHEQTGKKFDPSSAGCIRPVSFVSSCLMMYRASMLDRIGWQDERFFPRLEDIEHAARIHRMGYKQLYVPESIIYHKVAGEKESTFKLYYSVRNRLLLAREGFGGVAGTLATAYFLAVIIVKLALWRLFRRDFYLAARAGLVDYFRGNFGEGKGMINFPDARTQMTSNDRCATRQGSGTT